MAKKDLNVVAMEDLKQVTMLIAAIGCNLQMAIKSGDSKRLNKVSEIAVKECAKALAKMALTGTLKHVSEMPDDEEDEVSFSVEVSGDLPDEVKKAMVEAMDEAEIKTQIVSIPMDHTIN